MKKIESTAGQRLLSLILFPLLFSGCGGDGEPSTPSEVRASERLSTRDDSGPKYPDNIVAVVDDFLISREDAEKRAAMNMRRDGIEESDPDFSAKLRTARRGAVDMLIESYVLQQAATDSIEVTTREIDDELKSIQGRHPNRESYEEGLERAGYTEEEFREVLAKEIRIRKAMGTAAGKGVPTPTPEDSRDFYDKNPFLFEWPNRVRYDEIVWVLRPDISEASLEEAMREMNHLAERMRDTPELFGTILREATSSAWGPIGVRNPYLNMEDLSEEVREALKILNIDEPSQPVRNPLGISILCLRSTRQTFESANREILQSIYEARVMDNLETWKEKRREEHTVRILDLDYYEGKEGEGE